MDVRADRDHGGIAETAEFEFLLPDGILSDRSDLGPEPTPSVALRVRASIEEAELLEEDIQRLARARGLSVWNRPARACLGSRIPRLHEPRDEIAGQEANAERILRDGAPRAIGFAGKGIRPESRRVGTGCARVAFGRERT